MSVRYFKAGDKLAKWIVIRLDELDVLKRAARQFGRENGAADNGDFYFTSSFGVYTVCGWRFDATPPKGWVRMSAQTPGAYKPGAKHANRSTFDAMRSAVLRDIMDRIKMPTMKGLEVRQPGILVHRGGVYLTVPDDVTVRDGVRLTDVEFEKVEKAANRMANK